MNRSSRRFVGLILVAALGAALFASLPASAANPIGCVAVGDLSGECTFVSPGGTVKAIGAATAYDVVITYPNGSNHVCIAGASGVEQKSCPAPQGSLVRAHALVGVTAAILLWT